MIRRHSAALLTAIKAEKRSKHVPESDKISQTETQTILFSPFCSFKRVSPHLWLAWGEASRPSRSYGVITRKTLAVSRGTHRTLDDLVLEMIELMPCMR